MTTDLSKQEYLKRYLEDSSENKKRKKKVKPSKTVIPKIKILDQDISIKSIKFGTKEEVDEDESPVVAEIVDDRPAEVKSKEIYQASRWKRIGEESENVPASKFSPTHERTLMKKQKSNPSSNISKRHDSDGDFSPARVIRRHDSDSDLSPARVTKRHDSDSDCSPPRKQKSNSKADLHNSSKKHSVTENSAHLKSSNHQRRKAGSDSDLSPERPSRQKSDSDLSPERPRRNKSPRNAEHNSDSDLSPPRKNTHSSSRRNSPSTGKSQKPSKTLSGLKAGLQNANTLREETKELRKRENAQIRELDEELSGRNANTVVRDRQTGRRRDIDAELRVEEEKEKKNQEQQQKYAEWGKGVEQTESKKQKLSDDLYEMTKPLARYCDDEDLDEKLKEEIHDDDPMAQYMRKKKQKTVKSEYPMYNGPPPPPNRFGIPPGFRWDGVDRSNGFEKKYFEQKSSKKAVERDSYLWSVQDM